MTTSEYVLDIRTARGSWRKSLIAQVRIRDAADGSVVFEGEARELARQFADFQKADMAREIAKSRIGAIQ